MTTMTTTHQVQTLVALDLDAPTPSRIEGMREPDFIENERAYWIGPDATVSAWFTADMAHLSDVLERAGWMARTGANPATKGIVVTPHNPEVVPGPLMRNGLIYTIWQQAAEAVLVGA